MKLRDKGKRKFKRKVKMLTNKIYKGELSTKDAKKYLAGHLGYIKHAKELKLQYMADYVMSLNVRLNILLGCEW